MSKSVLVMDTPEKGCISCLIGRNYSNCRITRIYCPIAKETAVSDNAKTIPKWCPMRSLPEKKTHIAPVSNYELQKNLIVDGWNACIDEITGGNSDD